MSCNSEKQIDVQGHRGCRGLFPENSLPAFEKAIDLGVHTLELDIAITKDDQVVVSHEPFMSRKICYNPIGEEIPESMDMKYNLFEMTHQDIIEFDCGTKFHDDYPNQIKIKTHKPLLSEVFDLVKSKNADVKFNIEIKSKINKYNMFNRVNLQSFDVRVLRQIRRQSPHMPIALLVDENEDIWRKISSLDTKLPEIISPYYKLLDSIVVRNLRAEKFKIIPWTVNKEEDMKQMISWQVDGIITDYPNRLIEILKK
jgi:glycerophosphoryl diester phosphodiesterase